MLNMTPAAILASHPPRGHSVSAPASGRAAFPPPPSLEGRGEEAMRWGEDSFSTIKKDSLISCLCLLHWLLFDQWEVLPEV